MDKKNTVIGVVLLAAAFVSFYVSARLSSPPPPPTQPGQLVSPSTSTAPQTSPATTPSTTGTLPAIPQLSSTPPEFSTISNNTIIVRFTTAGGAIDSIELKRHRAAHDRPENYVINDLAVTPALSFQGFPGADQAARYEVVSKSDREVVFRTTSNNLEITRRYSLLGADAGDPYQIRHETTFRNLAEQSATLPRLAVNIGTAAPVNEEDIGMYLNVGYYDGEDFEHIERSKLEGGGFLSNFGIGSRLPLPYVEQPAPIQWASVKNKFFASILTPDNPGNGIRIERVKISPEAPAEDRRAYGVTGTAYFDQTPLAPGASSVWAATYFAGPKEYTRLSNTNNFKKNEDNVMQFGFFGWFAKLLVTIMNWVHNLIGGDGLRWGWGWAIVITTLLLKIVFVPFTIAASRSSKRMQKLMPMVTELREKHKDNPQKAQVAMMQLYKDYKVNPVGGCIPILITIPFFIGFFSMLQSTSELRFAPFLWAKDLSAPDTVAYILGLPLNIMPLLMGATMIIQMRLTPTPTTDNVQATMFKIMPWIFTLFCYNFDCALALYSTINGLFTIGQQMVINRLPEPQLAKAAPGTTAKGGMKNVTPKKKR